VADVGAVEGDDQGPGAGEHGAPGGQPVVDVDEVEALAAQQLAQAQGRRKVVAGAGRKAEHLDLDPAAADLLDLVAHPAPTLGSRGIRHEVGDDQHPHGG
jgi:hypothetical protein